MCKNTTDCAPCLNLSSTVCPTRIPSDRMKGMRNKIIRRLNIQEPMKTLNKWCLALLLALAFSACDDESDSPGKAVLQDKIKEAEQIRDAAVEGLEPGDNAIGS